MCGATEAPITPATSPKFAVSPSLNPYTTLRRNPPDPVLCQGSAARPARPASVSACAADSLASLSDTSRASSKLTSRSEEHTSELQSHSDLVCRLLLEKKKQKK